MNKDSPLRLLMVALSVILSVYMLLPEHYVDLSQAGGANTARLEVMSPARGWMTSEYVLKCTEGGGMVGEAEKLGLKLLSGSGQLLKDGINVGKGYTPGDRISPAQDLPDFRILAGSIEAGAEFRFRMVAEYMNMGLDLVGGSEIVYQIPLDEVSAKLAGSGNLTGAGNEAADRDPGLVSKREKLSSVISVFRKKLDNSGMKEIYVQAVGEDRILIQLPGLRKSEAQQIKKILETQGKLEFRIVNADKENLERAKDFKARGKTLPMPGFPYELVYRSEKDPKTGDRISVADSETLVLAKTSVTGKDIVRAWKDVDTQSLSGWAIHITFSTQGTKKFGTLTENNVGQCLAIILDGWLQSYPVIKEPIMNGECVISGSFTEQEADSLVTVLRSGSIDFKPLLLSENTVGPTLGADSIRSGLTACLIGAILVMAFIFYYYKYLGIVANFTIALNLVMLSAIMILFGGTLTMPGIAGYALTIGMAVDANILIYERIREEDARKQHMKISLSQGFDRAFITIFDSNLTTFITAVILYLVGNSAAIKGFALSLMVGLAVNMFTAVFVSHTLLAWALRKNLLQKYSMRQFFGATDYEFFGIGRFVRMGSYILIAVGIFFLYQRGREMLDVDFVKGTLLQVDLLEKRDISDIRALCEKAGFKATVQHFGNLSGKSYVIRTKELTENEKQEFKVFLRGSGIPLPADNDVAFPRDRTVGEVAATEIFLYAGGALILSMFGILFYLMMRFTEIKFGVGACVALAHDVATTLSVLAIVGMPISLTVFAGILTIVGYSVNDTIVIFDRIRENVGKQKSFDMGAVARRSVNQTLSRTILTNLTVFSVIFSLLIYGGGVIKDFAFTMFIGCITGTYSTIYIASPVMIWLHNRQKSRQQAEPAEPKARMLSPSV